MTASIGASMNDHLYKNRLADEDEFFSFVQHKQGNVFQLFKRYLNRPVSAKHGLGWDFVEPVDYRCEVWTDAVGCSDFHKIDDRGFWIGSEKLPKWFKRWVSACATGQYKTFFDGCAA